MITTLFLLMQKLRKRLTLTSVLAERKALRVRLLNWQCWRRQFSTMFL